MQIKQIANRQKLAAYYYIKYLNLFLRTLTLKRIVNYLKLAVSFKVSSLLKKASSKGKPVGVSVEPINICNLKCTECPTGTDTLTRTKGKISTQRFAKIINSITDKTWFLNLYFQGEPTIHPNFSNLIKLSKSKKFIVSSSTNAHFISKSIAEELVCNGLDILTISVDGITQDSYEKYRVGGDLQKVKSGIENMVEAKKKHKSNYPLLIAQFLVFRYNEDEIKQLKEWAHQSGIDKVQLKTAQIYNVNAKKNLIPKSDKYSRYKIRNNNAVLKGKIKNDCWKQWSSCVITWEGDLVPCCFDKNASYKIGNVLEQDFNVLWSSDELNSFREKVFREQKEIDICANCPMSRR